MIVNIFYMSTNHLNGLDNYISYQEKYNRFLLKDPQTSEVTPIVCSRGRARELIREINPNYVFPKHVIPEMYRRDRAEHPAHLKNIQRHNDWQLLKKQIKDKIVC